MLCTRAFSLGAHMGYQKKRCLTSCLSAYISRILDLTTVILPVQMGEIGPYEMFGDGALCSSKFPQKRRLSPNNTSSQNARFGDSTSVEANDLAHGDHYRPLTCSVLATTNVEVLCINR
jgi:hypothetical protein